MVAPLTIIETDDAQSFCERGTECIASVIRSSITERNRCLLGLSGGKTPAPIYEALGKEKDIDWSKVWIFLVDDRYIRSDSPHSNQFLLRSTLLRNAPIPDSQLLFPQTNLEYEACVTEYDQVIGAALSKQAPDLIVLGMGNDGHIASLFPPVPDEAHRPKNVIATQTEKFDIPKRISVTLPVLTKAKQALFLLQGKEKKRVWEDMMGSEEDEKRWPGKGVLERVATTVLMAG
ncbi:6-phosphogluconolactonase [Candidatus Peregrinibacteria bacterium]|nr:6-phosphogluconolactonase [Candidatus Peregrinibacteria bacterium]